MILVKVKYNNGELENFQMHDSKFKDEELAMHVSHKFCDLGISRLSLRDVTKKYHLIVLRNVQEIEVC